MSESRSVLELSYFGHANLSQGQKAIIFRYRVVIASLVARMVPGRSVVRTGYSLSTGEVSTFLRQRSFFSDCLRKCPILRFLLDIGETSSGNGTAADQGSSVSKFRLLDALGNCLACSGSR